MRTARRRTSVLPCLSGEGRHLFLGGGLRVDDLGDVVGEVLGGCSAEADGDDDAAVSPAESDHPGLGGWPPGGAGRSGVGLDGEGCGDYGSGVTPLPLVACWSRTLSPVVTHTWA